MLPLLTYPSSSRRSRPEEWMERIGFAHKSADPTAEATLRIVAAALLVAVASCCDNSVDVVVLSTKPEYVTPTYYLWLGDTVTMLASAMSLGSFCEKTLYTSYDRPGSFTYQSSDTSAVSLDSH